MSKQERVVCAAIRFTLVSNDSLRSIRETFMCVNYEDHFAKDAKTKMEGVEYFRIATKEKGFITSKSRFIEPEEALKISGLGNQLRFKDRKYLLPEDLY